MSGRLFYNIDGLRARLGKLPLPELLKVMEFLGITMDDINNQKGNLASWGLVSKVNSEISIKNKSAELHRLLIDVEERIGLRSPNFYPWPLTVEIDVTYVIEDNGSYYMATCEGLRGLLLVGPTYEEMWDKVREAAIVLILHGWGLDITAINDNISFDCLLLKTGELSVKVNNKEEFDKLISKCNTNEHSPWQKGIIEGFV